MLKFIFPVLLLIMCARLYGQTSQLGQCLLRTLFNCGADLTKEQFSDGQIMADKNISYAKIPGYALDVNYYNAVNPSLSDCGFPGSACSIDGSALTYDVYFPDQKFYPCYNTGPLPAVFIFPGSGFSDCADEEEGAEDYCMAFAKRGFIAFNVNYRKGRLKNPYSKEITASQLLAIYRACQDGRGAIRTAILLNTPSSPYRFDTTDIYVGGMSAGGQIALTVSYLTTETMYEKVFKGISDVLGPANADYYKGSTGIGFSVKGVMNLWGAFYTSSEESLSDFLTQNKNNPPVIAFHGLKDQVFIPGTIKGLLANKAPYNLETKCLFPGRNGTAATYMIDPDFKAITHSGSSGVYDALDNGLLKFVKSELYLDSDMGHGLDINSDFGFGRGKITRDSLKVYIVERAAVFFQTIANNRSTFLATTKFTDCVNYRVQSCGLPDLRDNNGCKGIIPIHGVLNDAHLKIYQENKTINIERNKQDALIITLFDLQGNIVKSKLSKNENESLDCSFCKPGMYLLLLKQQGAVKRVKIYFP
jgi:acetyl esterase/lipase